MLSSSVNHPETPQIHLVTPRGSPSHWPRTVTPYKFILVRLPSPGCSLFKMLLFGFSLSETPPPPPVPAPLHWFLELTFKFKCFQDFLKAPSNILDLFEPSNLLFSDLNPSRLKHKTDQALATLLKLTFSDAHTATTCYVICIYICTADFWPFLENCAALQLHLVLLFIHKWTSPVYSFFKFIWMPISRHCSGYQRVPLLFFGSAHWGLIQPVSWFLPQRDLCKIDNMLHSSPSPSTRSLQDWFLKWGSLELWNCTWATH